MHFDNETRRKILTDIQEVVETLTNEDAPEITVRAGVLREAESLITGDRSATYGPPDENFARIATYWNQYLLDNPPPLSGSDAAMMMVFVKIAREAHSHKRDSAVDAAGYIALYEELRAEESKW